MGNNAISLEEPENNDIINSVLEKEHLTRLEAMEIASGLILYLDKRVSAARFKEQQTDQTRLQYMRVMVQAIGMYATMLRDEEIADLTARIEALEKRGEACHLNN
jgi:polyhydroxyalkanoate synthesis regulator phasin